MSWAEEDWTVGLSGLALRKVKELQVQQERLQREKQQKQLQLDSTQTALNKQTVKYEEVRGELQSVQRDFQGAREEVQAGVCVRERLSLELQVKQAQVCSLEGQLDSARTLTHTLTQEVKRLEAELEKLQNSSSSGDSMLFSTPCWSMTSPWDHNGGRQEDRHGRRGEGDSKALHVRQELQFSDSPTPSPSFPRQPHKGTPNRHPSLQSDSSAPSAVFPWERDDPKSASRGRPSPQASSPAPPSADVTGRGQDSGDCGKAEGLEKGTDLSELRSRTCALEAELRAEAERLRQTQDQLTQTRRDLGCREQKLQKTCDELSLAHTCISQESDRASSAEQRLKQLQEELKCQRQNAESSRLQAQQRTRDLEKTHQRDLLELQKERLALEKQHQQEVTKLNQEIQQARTLHNTLQAQFEKVSLQKQAVEREGEGLKDKLKWTEAELRDCQTKEAQTQAKLTVAQRESEGLSVTVEQSRRKEKGLEEEVKRLTQELADALRLLKELQDQKASQVVSSTPVHFSPPGQSFTPLPPSHHARPSAHIPKRPARSELVREGEEEAEDGGSAGRRANYPTEREPGEGIDSEHIHSLGSHNVENPRRAGERGRQEERKMGETLLERVVDDTIVRDDSTKSQDIHVTHVAHTDAETPTCSRSEKPVTSNDLQRENAALRSELRDVKEELTKRLEDLESQRRAESEARTRLKQLSRKHTTQTEHVREKEEQERERKRELDEERAETGRLKKALTALEAEVKKEREEREWRESETDRERERDQEDRESQCIEVNIQLKKQLAEVKTLLALEREEREMEKEEERKRTKNKLTDGTMDLTLKLTELEAELKELKNRGNGEGKNANERNSPLTYLTLESDINSDINTVTGSKFLPSPDQYRLFCESSNRQNIAVSRATASADLIHEEITKLPEHSVLSSMGQTTVDAKQGSTTSDPGQTTLESQRGESVSHSDSLEPQGISNANSEETTKVPQGGMCASELAQEVERLRGESSREAGRARQTQAKLEALQAQVTRQTQQLTLAFDKQSQHIVDLLGELQLKEGALLSQGGELQRCREELAWLRAQSQKEQVKTNLTKQEKEEERNTETPEEKRRDETEQGEEREDRLTQKQRGKLDERNEFHQHVQESNKLQPSLLEEPTTISPDLTTVPPEEPTTISPDDTTVPPEAPTTISHDDTTVPPEASTTISHDDTTVLLEAPTTISPDDTTVPPEAPTTILHDDTTVSPEAPTTILPDDTIVAPTTISPIIPTVPQELSVSRIDVCPAKTEDGQLQSGFLKAPGGHTITPEDSSHQSGLLKTPLCHTMTPEVSYRQGQDGGEENVSKELQTLKEENQQLKLRLVAVEASSRGPRSSVSKTTLPETVDNPDNAQVEKKNTGNDLTSLSVEQDRAYLTEGVSSIKAGIKSSPTDEEEHDDEKREDTKDEKEFETGAEKERNSDMNSVDTPQISCLQQKVVALQAELQILSEENRRQAEELVLWRLMSMDQTQEQTTFLGKEDLVDSPVPGGSPISVTVIREDELLLSCSSNRLYGQTLASRIQHCNSPEPSTVRCSQRKPSYEPQEQVQWSPEGHEDREDKTMVVTKEAHSKSGPQIEAGELVHKDTSGSKTKSKPRDQTQTKDVEPRENVPHTACGVEAQSNQSPSLEIQTVPEQLDTNLQEPFPVSSVVDDVDRLTSSHSNVRQTTTTTIYTSESHTTVEVKGQRLEQREGHLPQATTAVSFSGRLVEEEPVKSVGGRGSKFSKVVERSPSSERGSPVDVRSTSTQTEDESEEGPAPSDTSPTPPQLHHASTQTEVEEEEEEEDEELADSPPLSPIPPAEGANRLLFSVSFPIPADPARLAERIRRNRSQMSAAYDDTEYEPYGLPEVVMKGFADIPSGPACPYIVRRGLLGTPAVPLPHKEPGPKEAGRGRPNQP